jgi:hypothetical protein
MVAIVKTTWGFASGLILSLTLFSGMNTDL